MSGLVHARLQARNLLHCCGCAHTLVQLLCSCRSATVGAPIGASLASSSWRGGSTRCRSSQGTAGEQPRGLAGYQCCREQLCAVLCMECLTCTVRACVLACGWDCSVVTMLFCRGLHLALPVARDWLGWNLCCSCAKLLPCWMPACSCLCHSQVWGAGVRTGGCCGGRRL